ncbi:TRCF domain-containing protein [Novosphingobium sp. ST904]|uniref:TRCF domain-containing protein n=1 Tax=Novosphingobium sp. ST904 TaxID=1684385 RepID=UPI000AFFC5D3|nr:TRCF domain-containing protein [Novosphingobium sp. ST904]
MRLALYMRLARIDDEAELDAFEDELLDRFGPLPDAAEVLMDHSRIRIGARTLRIARIDAGPAAIALTPRRDFSADASRADLTKKDGRLLLSEKTANDERITRVRVLLETLGP